MLVPRCPRPLMVIFVGGLAVLTVQKNQVQLASEKIKQWNNRIERWNVENMSLSAFNLEKFSYQRKPSTCSRRDPTGISNQPCASTNTKFTLNSQSAHSSSSERKSRDSPSSCDSNQGNNELESCADDPSFTATIFASQEFVDVMDSLTSETRVQIVEALTSSSKENMNPGSDNIIIDQPLVFKVIIILYNSSS